MLQMSSRPCPTACVMRASPWSLRSHVAVSGPRPNTLRIREQILASMLACIPFQLLTNVRKLTPACRACRCLFSK